MSDLAAEPPPHLDPVHWTELIDAVGVPAILVVISSWMGRKLERHCSAEDVWQETLWMAWRDREQHRWRGLRAFRAWLLGIARHRVHGLAEQAGAAKRGGRENVVHLSGLADTQGSVSGALPPRSSTPSRVAWHAERAAQMSSALEQLPGKLEPVVRLRLLEELPMREVADRLGIGLSTAKERFAAGAALYRQLLTKIETRCGERPAP